MAGNSFGQAFRISTCGESHGRGLAVIIDGCPPGVEIDPDFIQKELDRRKPGQSTIVSRRRENEEFEIISGVYEGRTTGTPIGIVLYNQDQKSADYDHLKDVYRPSHADFTYQSKYAHRDHRGGGRSSARETAMRVAAGAVAKMFLQQFGIKIQAYVSRIGPHFLSKNYQEYALDLAEENIVRCPDPDLADKMIAYVKSVRKAGDSAGGIVSAVIQGCPTGLGEPVFDRLHADMGKAMLCINAVKGFEYGSGFACAGMRGSEHNDPFLVEKEKVKTKSNYSGGIQGGISNGMDIYFNVAFKPVATLMMDQEEGIAGTVDLGFYQKSVEAKGRHDPCVLPRAVPIVESMAALVLADHWVRYNGSKINKST